MFISAISEKGAECFSTVVTGLTILAHPDPRRVGEQAVLADLTTGREARLSRLEPEFKAPGEATSRPLADLHLSRQPIGLAPGVEAGAVVLDCSATRTAVEADGRSLVDTGIFTAGQIARGVVLVLCRQVTLLLHLMPPEPPQGLWRFGLLGASSRIERVRQEIRQAAALDVPVMLRGETGTGKELVARAIHSAGERCDRPFVAVNMGAVPPSLAASELFGSARGAFTGADRKRVGYFQQAHHGTLLLDEIGETPLELQGLLLRALENGEIQPVGSVRREAVDVRVIAATDVDLEAAVAAGRFRGPLYYRLAGFLIRLPPLRERRDDLGRLLHHFLDEAFADSGGPPTPAVDGASPWPPAEVVARLARYDWPGNVRELRNVARRLVIARLAGGGWALDSLLDELLGPADAVATPASLPAGAHPAPLAAALPAAGSPGLRRRRFRKPSEVSEDELLEALEVHRWRVKPSAAALGVSRATLYRLIDGSERLRKAAEIDRQEIEEALARSSGDLAAAARSLQVSPEGLRIRMTALGVR